MEKLYKDKNNTIIKEGQYIKVSGFQYPKLVSKYIDTLNDINKYLTVPLKVCSKRGIHNKDYSLSDLIVNEFIIPSNDILTNVEIVNPLDYVDDVSKLDKDYLLNKIEIELRDLDIELRDYYFT